MKKKERRRIRKPSYAHGETLDQTIRPIMDNMILNLGRLQDALPWFMLTYFWEDTNQILDKSRDRCSQSLPTASYSSCILYTFKALSYAIIFLITP
jgi:hypothetical protein